MSIWKKFEKYKTLNIALVVGFIIVNLVVVIPTFATYKTTGSTRVLSVPNKVVTATTVFNKLDAKDVDVTVTTGTDLTAMKIINGKYVLTENDYTIVGNKVTIFSTYLSELTTRSAKLKFDFASGTDKYLTITLKNESASISAKSISFTNKSTKDIPVTVKANGLTLQGISYAEEDLPKDAYSEGAPSSSGSVKVSIKASYLATLANDTTKKLVFNYSGAGTNPAITLKVSGSKVITVSSVIAVTRTTTVGVAPVLPEQVTAIYTDSSRKLVDVTWDAIDPSEYAEARTFYVEGTIAGTTVKANAIVIVSMETDPTDWAVIAATQLVVKAEGSKTQVDKDAALVAVNALPLSPAKTALLARVNAIVVEPAETEFEIIEIL